MTLNPEDFRLKNGLYRASMRTNRDGLVDLSVAGADAPSPAAFMELNAAASNIDWLRKRAITAAAHHREATLQWRAAPDSAWSLNGLSANDAREIVVSLYESEIDEYGDWEVTFLDGEVVRVERKQI